MLETKKQFEPFSWIWFTIICFVIALVTLPACAQDNGTKSASTRPGPIFTVAEQPPVFPGGDEAMKTYLDANLKFPAGANQKFRKQKIPVKFIVTENGTIDSVRILKPKNKLVDTEVLKVIERMPAWLPARQSGHTVAFWQTISVRFP